MTTGQHKTVKRFALTAAGSAIYLLAESILKAFGTSICPTDGCKAVASATRFGDWPFLALGMLAFAAAAVSARRLYRNPSDHTAHELIDILLSIALPVEALLVSYQYLFLQTACLFCLSVLLLWTTLLIMRASKSWPQRAYQPKPAMIPISAIAIVITVFLLSPPPSTHQALPLGQGLSLFYNHNCPHCSSIISKMEEHSMKFTKYAYADYAPILKSAGITQVPTLMLTHDKKRVFITGETLISSYIEQGIDMAPTAHQDATIKTIGSTRSIFLTEDEIRTASRNSKQMPSDTCEEQSKAPCPQ